MSLLDDNGKTTVLQLIDLMDRTKKALNEGGRPTSAVHVRVGENGDVRIVLGDLPDETVSDAVLDKAMSLDPDFERIYL